MCKFYWHLASLKVTWWCARNLDDECRTRPHKHGLLWCDWLTGFRRGRCFAIAHIIRIVSWETTPPDRMTECQPRAAGQEVAEGRAGSLNHVTRALPFYTERRTIGQRNGTEGRSCLWLTARVSCREIPDALLVLLTLRMTRWRRTT